MKAEKKLERLQDKYDRLCLWSTNYKLIDKIEKEIEELEVRINREEKLKELGV